MCLKDRLGVEGKVRRKKERVVIREMDVDELPHDRIGGLGYR